MAQLDICASRIDVAPTLGLFRAATACSQIAQSTSPKRGFMNLHMRDIVCTSRDGERFWKIPECYVRGNSISAGLVNVFMRI